MKNFYIAVTVCQDKSESVFEPDEKRAPEPGYHAFVMTVSEADNMKSRLDNIGGIITAQICSSRKAASDIVSRWNASFIANGEHLFASPAF